MCIKLKLNEFFVVILSLVIENYFEWNFIRLFINYMLKVFVNDFIIEINKKYK